MKKLFAGLAGLTVASALAFSANAADLYAGGGYKDYAPAAVWSGFYFGGNLGYGWGASGQLACTGTNCVPAFGGVSPSGWFGGVQGGYNWQRIGSPFVLGVETDIQASTILGQGADTSGAAYKSRLQALGTVRGRAGYAMDRALVYFTGGLAYGSVDNEASGAALVNNQNSVVTGYVLGGGLEYKVKRDLSVKVEYQYVNLGKNDPVDGAGVPYSSSTFGGTVHDDAFNTVRVGVNYFPFVAGEPLK
jgi:outer membrane immunogenic protein